MDHGVRISIFHAETRQNSLFCLNILSIKFYELGKFNHSKNQVKKATRALRENKLSFEEKAKNIEILANFRSSHAYPMQSMIVHFRKKAFGVDRNAIVVRRLKRIPSIINKLKRFPSMSITTMGDIGGIRVILQDMTDVNKLRGSLLKDKTRNQLLSEKNYMINPKESGYRSIHLMYSYQGSKENYRDFKIELQIRSKIQHSWATAVEVIGTFNRQNLKAGQGDEEWLSFFKIVSEGFKLLEEQQPLSKELKDNITSFYEELKVSEILQSFRVVAKHSDKKQGYYLLQLSIEKRAVSARFFPDQYLEEAYEEYRRMEQEISEDLDKDVVLVSAQSIKDLKNAYTNYYADTELFLRNLQKLL